MHPSIPGNPMASIHAASGELIDILPFGTALRQAASATLVREDHVEVFRLVLLSGKSLPGHDHPRVITIQCIEGSIELIAAGRAQAMRAGTLVYLSGGVPHTLTAIEDSSLLVTLLLRRE
jgi:quercetin dioxygenase-like cupin family protein